MPTVRRGPFFRRAARHSRLPYRRPVLPHALKYMLIHVTQARETLGNRADARRRRSSTRLAAASRRATAHSPATLPRTARMLATIRPSRPLRGTWRSARLSGCRACSGSCRRSCQRWHYIPPPLAAGHIMTGRSTSLFSTHTTPAQSIPTRGVGHSRVTDVPAVTGAHGLNHNHTF